MAAKAAKGSGGEQQVGVTRRALLKTGLLGGAVVLVGGTGLALRQTLLRPMPAAGLKVLDAKEYSILSAVADRVAPRLGADAPGANAVQVVERLDLALSYAEPEGQKGFKLALAIFESGLFGALFAARARPFTQLTPVEQDADLAGMRDSSVMLRRMLHKSLTGPCAALYYADQRLWPSVGYPGPPDPKALRAAFAFNLVDLHALRVGVEAGTTPDLPAAEAPAPDVGTRDAGGQDAGGQDVGSKD